MFKRYHWFFIINLLVLCTHTLICDGQTFETGSLNLSFLASGGTCTPATYKFSGIEVRILSANTAKISYTSSFSPCSGSCTPATREATGSINQSGGSISFSFPSVNISSCSGVSNFLDIVFNSALYTQNPLKNDSFGGVLRFSVRGSQNAAGEVAAKFDFQNLSMNVAYINGSKFSYRMNGVYNSTLNEYRNDQFVLCNSESIKLTLELTAPLEHVFNVNLWNNKGGGKLATIESITTSSYIFEGTYLTVEFKLADFPIVGDYIFFQVVDVVNGRETNGGVALAVVSAPANQPTITADKALLCSSNEKATITLSNPSDNTDYQWSSGEKGSSIHVNKTGKYTVEAFTYIKTSGGNLQVCNGVPSNELAIDIFNFEASIAPPDSRVKCSGESISLSANATGDFTYDWKLAGTSVGTSQSYQATQGGIYTVTVKPSKVNCEAKTSGPVELAFDAPIANEPISASANIICGAPGPTEVTLTANPDQLRTYNWTREGDNSFFQSGRMVTISQAGTYKVSMSKGACSQQQQITISDNNYNPEIASAVGAYCSNTPISLMAITNNPDQFDYVWTRDGTTVGGNTATLDLDGALGTFTYLLAITAKDKSCPTKKSKEKVIKVDQAITGADIGLPATKKRAIICGMPEEKSIDLQATADTPLDNIAYAWSGPQSGSSAVLSAQSPGTYLVTFTRGACVATASTQVEIGAFTPSMEIVSATLISSPTEARICQGEGAGLRAIATGTSFANSSENFVYEWFGGADATVPLASQTEPSLPVSASGSYALKMTLKDSGCKSKDATPKAITILADPEIRNVRLTPDPAVICNKTQGLTLTALTDSSAGVRYTWTGNGQAKGDSQYVVHNAGTYSVTFTRGACSKTLSVSPREEELTVKVTPPNQSVPIIVCSGDNAVSMELKAESNLSTATVKWYRDNGIAALGNSTGNVYTPTESGLYYAVADFNNICTATSSQKISIEALGQFSVGISPADTPAICDDRSFTLRAEASEARFEKLYNYTWNQENVSVKKGVGAAGSELTTGKNVIYEGNTLASLSESEFVVSVEKDGCKASSASRKLTLKASRPAIIALDFNTLEATQSIDEKYQWFYRETVFTSESDTTGYTLLSDANGRTLMGVPKGSYIVKANHNACGSRYSGPFLVDLITAVNPPAPESWKIFPNPIADALTLERSSPPAKPATVSMHNVKGQLLWKSQQRKASNTYKLDDIPAGTYLLEVVDGNRVIQQKIIKQ